MTTNNYIKARSRNKQPDEFVFFDDKSEADRKRAIAIVADKALRDVALFRAVDEFPPLAVVGCDSPYRPRSDCTASENDLRVASGKMKVKSVV